MENQAGLLQAVQIWVQADQIWVQVGILQVNQVDLLQVDLIWILLLRLWMVRLINHRCLMDQTCQKVEQMVLICHLQMIQATK